VKISDTPAEQAWLNIDNFNTALIKGGIMKYKTLFVTDAIVLLLVGLGQLLLPGRHSEMYGATLQPPGIAMGRFYGASMLALAWIMWKARGSEASVTIDGLMQGNILLWVLSVGIALLGQAQGTFNPMGWSNIVLGVFFAAWFTCKRYAKS
jgi:hypothetical protein